MTDPKVLRAGFAAIAAGLLVTGLASLDWRFLAASALASLAVIGIGIRAVGWHALNPFDKGR
jgi:hypothetical protein